MAKTSGFKPGEKIPASAQYGTVGLRGGKGPEIAGIQGKKFPPPEIPGSTYRIVDRTKNDSGKGK